MDFALRLQPEIQARSVDAKAVWDLRAFEVIQNYLQVHKPRQTIQMLDGASELLRQALLQHFALQDVLLAEHRSRHREED